MKTETISKKDAKVLKNIASDKEIQKGFKKADNEYYNNGDFLRDAKRYIKAIKEDRMICNIDSVSKSGMSRNIKFLSCEKSKARYNYCQYSMLFTILGFQKARNNDWTFTIHGCGMDMIFHTNYTIINRLGRLGLLSKKEVSKLEQETPSVI